MPLPGLAVQIGQAGSSFLGFLPVPRSSTLRSCAERRTLRSEAERRTLRSEAERRTLRSCAKRLSRERRRRAVGILQVRYEDCRKTPQAA